MKFRTSPTEIRLDFREKSVTIEFQTLIMCLFAPLILFNGWAAIATDSTMYSPAFAAMNKVYTYFCVAAVLGLYIWKHEALVEWNYVYLLIPPVAYWIMYYFNRYDPDLPANITNIFVISLFLLLNREIKSGLFRTYRKILVVVSVIGIVAYVLYFLGFDSLFQTVPYYSGNPEEQYISYGLGYFYRNPYEFRLCGHYNEPGFFGTVAALVLCGDDLDYKKIGNLFIFIAGCLTMSLAFFMIVLAYFVLKFLAKAVKNPKLWIVVAAVLFLYFYVLPRIRTGNYTIDSFLQRFVIVDGRLLGDNRTTDAFDALYEQFWLSDRTLFGFGDGYIAASNVGQVLIYKIYLIEFGIVGFILIFGVLLLNAVIYSKGNLRALFLIAVFALSIYQRPNIIRLIYFVILFGGISHLQLRDKKAIKKQTE